jgi:hypothetical protein
MGSPATKKLRFTYNLRPVILPSRGMLRVLDLACCNLKLPRRGGDDAMSFPHLSSLRLYKCVSPIKSLQRLLRAAPSLRSLHIESHDYSFCGSNRSRLALRFPALTSLTLVEMVPLMLDGDDGASQVKELPGLSGCWFSCLENHLKNVTLQFELNELESFEVCLAKFFAENCKVLDVLQIDDGNLNFLSHINWTVRRWRANALERRKQIGRESPDSSKCKHGGKRKHQYDLQRKVKSKS